MIHGKGKRGHFCSPSISSFSFPLFLSFSFAPFPLSLHPVIVLLFFFSLSPRVCAPPPPPISSIPPLILPFPRMTPPRIHNQINPVVVSAFISTLPSLLHRPTRGEVRGPRKAIISIMANMSPKAQKPGAVLTQMGPARCVCVSPGEAIWFFS